MRNIDIVHSFAGALVLIGSALAWQVSAYWLILTAFVGLNLFQFGFTKWCPLELILSKLRKGKD